MTLEDGLRVRSIPRRVVRFALIEGDWALVLLGVAYMLAYCSFFVVMHLKSQAWAPGQVLSSFDGYWSWFYRTIFSEERVVAARRSQLAAVHPFWMLASMAGISGIYLLMLRWLRLQSQVGSVDEQPRLRALIGLALLASLPLLMLPNLLSGDVYSYISFGRVAVVHGGNPFIDPPAAYRDPFLSWVNWKQVASVYGPGWIYPSMVLTLLLNSFTPTVTVYVLAYKLLALVLHLLNGALIWAILDRWQPERRAWGTALYLLSPLALIEFAGNAHNDVLMITFILAGIWLHQRDHWYWTIAAFTMAVLTKWIALPLLPLYGLALLWESHTWRERMWRSLASLIIFAALCVSLYRPYWEGARTLEILFDAPPQQRLINSLGDVIANDIQRGMWSLGRWPNPALADPVLLFSAPNPAASYRGRNNDLDSEAWAEQRASYLRDRAENRKQQAIAREHRDTVNSRVRTAALVILGLSCLIGAAATRTFRQALLAGAWIFFVYCSIGAVWFWPWYVTWFVALAALLDWQTTGRTAVLFSLLVPLTYIFYPNLPDPVWWQRYRAVLIFVPPLLYASWCGLRVARQAWQTWRSERRTPVVAES